MKTNKPEHMGSSKGEKQKGGRTEGRRRRVKNVGREPKSTGQQTVRANQEQIRRLNTVCLSAHRKKLCQLRCAGDKSVMHLVYNQENSHGAPLQHYYSSGSEGLIVWADKDCI